MMSFLYFFSITLFILLCLLTCTVVLLQESKSGSLGSSFGGEASESVFGTSTAEVLKKFTAWLGLIFLSACVILSLWTGALSSSSASTSTLPEIEKPVSS